MGEERAASPRANEPTRWRDGTTKSLTDVTAVLSQTSVTSLPAMPQPQSHISDWSLKPDRLADEPAAQEA